MKKIIITVISLSLLVFILFIWTIVGKGYDKQNKSILFLKEIVPPHIAKKVRDTLFFIPDLKKRNAFLAQQVEKYDQGLNGNLFKKDDIKTKQGKTFEVKEFFLPFPRLDTRLGWAATENSKRAHYLEVIGDKVLVISGLGQTIYFDKKNITSNQLKQIEINNNISKYLETNNFKLIGIRDLYVDTSNNFVYISLQHKDDRGYTINLYRAKLNFDNLVFQPFFITKEYWQDYNVFSGGRIDNFKNNEVLFSIGYANVDKIAQNTKSLLGKIISINKDNSKYRIISIGHRNPQGLYYVRKKNIIINTEHGPKGGDEVNLNHLNSSELPNYGWDIASYGSPYKGEDTFKKSHLKYGFVEPFKNYTPSIGISEVINLTGDINKYSKNNTIYISSLRAGSIYIVETNDELTKIINEDRLFFRDQRIRDFKFDPEYNVFFLLFEHTPSIGIVKYLN